MQASIANIKDVFQFKLKPEGMEDTLMLCRIDNKYELYRVVSTSSLLEQKEQELNGWVKIPEFAQVPIPESGSIRIVPLLESVLMVVVDDG